MATDGTSSSDGLTSGGTTTTGSPAAPDISSVFSAAGTTAQAAVESVLLNTPTGSRGTNALKNTYFGINHRQTPNALQINKDHYGLTFFTRPNLNLSLGNLRSVRLFNPLTTTNPETIQRIIRCYLSPRENQGDTGAGTAAVTTPYVDPLQAFIPLLTNALKSTSGWPDITVPYNTSHEGLYKEQYSIVDGVTDIYSAYDITANFRNIQGDPITAMFFYWAHYMSNVFQGNMVPYPDMVVENELDYQTRIYRVVLDASRTYVQKIAACGAAFPTADPMGGSFNYDSEKPYNDTNQDISIPFHCVGAIYQDPILLYTFNKTVVDFNHSMADSVRAQLNTQIPMAALQLFNNRGYPRINPDTWELEWWIDNATYQALLPNAEAQELSLWFPAVTTGDSNPSGIANSQLYSTPFSQPTVNTSNVSSSVIQSPPVTQNNS
jgi:hypothetical protein